MKVEEFFSEGFRLAKTEYWTIFFNFLIYILLIIIASITVIGLLIVPSLAVGLVRFTIRAGRGEEVDVGDSISWGLNEFIDDSISVGLISLSDTGKGVGLANTDMPWSTWIGN